MLTLASAIFVYARTRHENVIHHGEYALATNVVTTAVENPGILNNSRLILIDAPLMRVTGVRQVLRVEVVEA